MDTGHNKATKRKNSDEDYDSDQAYLKRYKKTREEILKAKLYFPRFLMMTSGDDEKSLSRLSTFAIQKGIQGLVGEPKTIKRLRSGDLLNRGRQRNAFYQASSNYGIGPSACESITTQDTKHLKGSSQDS